MKILLRPIPVMLAVLVCAGLSVLSCGDKDSVTEPLTPEYLDVYVVTTINGKPFDSEAKIWRYFPSMLNIRLDEDTNTFSGYVQITDVGWLPISVHTFERRFTVTAPDSLLPYEFFGFSHLNHHPPVLSGHYFAGGSTLDYPYYTFEATLTPVPVENVMNDEYYFAAGPGKTKVFVVESIGGYPLDKLPAEWGDVYPTMLEPKYFDKINEYFHSRVYFTSLGWLDYDWYIFDDTSFTIEYQNTLAYGFSFYNLAHDFTFLTGMYRGYGNGVPSITQPFVARLKVISKSDLPK